MLKFCMMIIRVKLRFYEVSKYIYLLLLFTPNSLPGRGRFWRGAWQRREVERERKGEKKFCHGAGPLPKVLNLQEGGMGGTVEEVGSGVGGSIARGAEVVRGPANPLQVGFEGRTEPRTKLGQGGAIRTGEGSLLVRDGRGRGLEDSIV